MVDRWLKRFLLWSADIAVQAFFIIFFYTLFSVLHEQVTIPLCRRFFP